MIYIAGKEDESITTIEIQDWLEYKDLKYKKILPEDFLSQLFPLLTEKDVIWVYKSNAYLNRPETGTNETISMFLANDNYLVLKSQNDLNYSLLLLQQLLGMKYDSLFAIESSDTIFEARMNQNQFDYRNLSEMELAELKLEKQSIKIKSIKGKFYPALSLNGSLGSGYSENRKYLTPQGDWLPTTFSSQITENFYQSASLSLSIPIFNKNTTRSDIQVNMLELKKLELNKEQQGLDVMNKLEQLKMDVSNAKALFKSSLVVLESVKLNYDNYLFQYENSIVNYNQLLETKDKLYQAQSKLIQAKYQMKFKKLLFEIYTY